MHRAAKWIAVAFLSFASAEASAGLVSVSPSCSSGNALTVMQPDAVACLGAFDGNDANQRADVLAAIQTGFASQVGSGTWSFTEKVDKTNSGVFFKTVPGTTTGTIEFQNPLTGFFGLVLKASNQFSIYLFDATSSAISAVDFTTIGTSVNVQGRPQNLSHASLYEFDAPQVPLPPAMLLFGSALGVTGMLARYRKRRVA